MDRASGDQRGSLLPTDPGRAVIWPLPASNMPITLFGSCPPNEDRKRRNAFGSISNTSPAYVNENSRS